MLAMKVGKTEEHMHVHIPDTWPHGIARPLMPGAGKIFTA
jgi:hypothetical protein